MAPPPRPLLSPPPSQTKIPERAVTPRSGAPPFEPTTLDQQRDSGHGRRCDDDNCNISLDLHDTTTGSWGTPREGGLSSEGQVVNGGDVIDEKGHSEIDESCGTADSAPGKGAPRGVETEAAKKGGGASFTGEPTPGINVRDEANTTIAAAVTATTYGGGREDDNYFTTESHDGIPTTGVASEKFGRVSSGGNEAATYGGVGGNHPASSVGSQLQENDDDWSSGSELTLGRPDPTSVHWKYSRRLVQT